MNTIEHPSERIYQDFISQGALVPEPGEKRTTDQLAAFPEPELSVKEYRKRCDLQKEVMVLPPEALRRKQRP